MTFGEKLKILRVESGLSQEAFAERMEVSRQAVSKWELGQAYPEVSKLIELCDYFGTSMDVLVRDREVPPEEEPPKAVEPPELPEDIPAERSPLAPHLLLITVGVALFWIGVWQFTLPTGLFPFLIGLVCLAFGCERLTSTLLAKLEERKTASKCWTEGT